MYLVSFIHNVLQFHTYVASDKVYLRHLHILEAQIELFYSPTCLSSRSSKLKTALNQFNTLHDSNTEQKKDIHLLSKFDWNKVGILC